MAEVILLLGSNKGDRADYLRRAVERLSSMSDALPLLSKVYESEPWGFDTKTWFLNLALRVETDSLPQKLLSSILDIERELGRVRNKNLSGYESREIDIDIIFYDDLVVNDEFLTIPHPRLHLRRFVLLPISEIAPDFKHPLLYKSVRELLDLCNDSSVVFESKTYTI